MKATAEYILVLLVRLLWAGTIGLVFMALGLVLYILLDLLVPRRTWGMKSLVRLFELWTLRTVVGMNFLTQKSLELKEQGEIE